MPNEIKTTIHVDGSFCRYGRNILNRADVAEANVETGEVLMRSGHAYRLPRKVMEAWFSNIMDYMKIEGNL